MYRIADYIGLLDVKDYWVYRTWVFRVAELGWLDLYICWICGTAECVWYWIECVAGCIGLLGL